MRVFCVNSNIFSKVSNYIGFLAQTVKGLPVGFLIYDLLKIFNKTQADINSYFNWLRNSKRSLIIYENFQNLLVSIDFSSRFFIHSQASRSFDSRTPYNASVIFLNSSQNFRKKFELLWNLLKNLKSQPFINEISWNVLRHPGDPPPDPLRSHVGPRFPRKISCDSCESFN